jgi:hypothetical protein
MKFKFITLLTFIFLTGCSTLIDDPVFQSRIRDFDTKKIEDENISYRIGWLGQYLLEPQTRQEIAGKLIENSTQSKSIFKQNIDSTLDVSLGGQMLTDLAVGDVGSGLGSSVGTGLFVAGGVISLFSGDGSIDNVSGINFPEIFEGNYLETAEQAQTEALSLIDQQLINASQELGYSAKCVYQCDISPRVYHLKKLNITGTAKWIYEPDEIAVYVGEIKMLKVEETQFLDSFAVGFKVAWRTEYGNTAVIRLISDPILDKNNKIVINHPDPNDPKSFTYRGKHALFSTDIGDAFNRAIHNTPYTFTGSSDDHPKALYYNGDVYNFGLNSRAQTFDKYILEVNKRD